jgi:hypothetical protein
MAKAPAACAGPANCGPVLTKIKATAKIARRANPRNVKSPSPEVMRGAS